MPIFAPKSVQVPLARQMAKRRALGLARVFTGAPKLGLFSHVNGGTGVHSQSTSSLSWTLNDVTVGDLVLVGVTAYSASGITLKCSDGTNTYVEDVHTSGNNSYVAIFRSVVTTGGNLTITITPNVACVLSMGVDEYAFPPGYLVALDGVTGTGSGTSGSLTTGNLSPTTTGLVYGIGSGQENNLGTLTAGSGFTSRYNYSPSSANQTPICCEDITANTTTPITVTETASPGSHWVIVGAAYKATIPPIYASPWNLPANHANPITITLTGTGTSWSSGGTTFTVTGDATLTGSTVISATSAILTVTTGAITGSATISDGTYTAALTVATAAFSLTPPGVGPNTATTITATGTNTLWLSEASPQTLFSVSGVAGLMVSNVVITGNTAATFTLTSGSATGTATGTDTSTTATAVLTVFAVQPAITPAPILSPPA